MIQRHSKKVLEWLQKAKKNGDYVCYFHDDISNVSLDGSFNLENLFYLIIKEVENEIEDAFIGEELLYGKWQRIKNKWNE